MDIEEVATNIVDAAIQVHRALGPGLLESVYQQCLMHELCHRGMKVQSEVPVPVVYDGIVIEVGFRADLIIEKCVLIENKTVDHILPVHEAQLLTYLKLSRLQVGFLINWNVTLIKDGIKRYVNNVTEPKWRKTSKNTN